MSLRMSFFICPVVTAYSASNRLKKGLAHRLSGMAKCVALAANSRPGGNIVTGAAIADQAASLAGSTYFTDMLRDASSSWRGLIDGSGASSSSGIELSVVSMHACFCMHALFLHAFMLLSFCMHACLFLLLLVCSMHNMHH